ncbi:MAG: tetratricopeptide repeat protein [Treponema sp.]|jgi:tetratricopeptide (TPR) repeat protein|nr:tetratricopeptide repeat protein [Treponema sp.]
MAGKRSKADYGLHFHRRRVLHNLAAFLALLLAVGAAVFVGYRWYAAERNERALLLEYWQKADYEAAHKLAGELLEKRPLDYQTLSLRGFSAFQLADAQINSGDALEYLDDCIRSLRKALITKNAPREGSLSYVLGKAYYHKNEHTGLGYAALAVKYLEQAREAAYEAPDLPEYLGLAYVGIKEYHKSVAALSEALRAETVGGAAEAASEAEAGSEAEPAAQPAAQPSDILLLAIARSYLELKQWDQAKAYLHQCISISKDSKTINIARLLLGRVSLDTGAYQEAIRQYRAVLSEESDRNADAWFQLGEVYYAMKDTTRARAQWRQTLKVNPGHRGARSRLNM